VVIQHEDGPVALLPTLDFVDGPVPDGLAGYLATAFDDGREPQ
jgi:hypothetical protein